MMTRDNSSNIVKACNDWKISRFGCIQHSLHLVVGPLFVLTRNTKTDEVVDTLDIDNEIDSVIEYDQDDVINHVEQIEIH